ncbi:MAG TPA: NUDIX domain-containing protein [Chitinophagaceae bacterium]|nr:NUDIX domain-containing protein [Chitinophagaceae bacterium]
MQLPTAGLLLIRDRKLLLAFSNKKKCYYLPGGKIEAGESPSAALCREIEEELRIRLNESDLRFYTHISAPAFGEPPGVIMEQDCFLVHTQGEPFPSGEIGALRYFGLADYLDQPVTAPGAVLILERLKADQLID